MKKVLNEGLDYHDMKDQVVNKITVDEYAARAGRDSDIITITFTVKSKLASKDLTTWLEMGYDFIVDASESTGEIKPGEYLVFAEMQRRMSAPERIIEILSDLQTLTDISLDEWEVEVDDSTYPANKEQLLKAIITSPHEYREQKEHEKELNEYRQIAGLETSKMHQDDEYIKSIKELAGI